MTDRALEAWETSAPGPFVTIRAGGPLDGAVTITAIAGGRGRRLVRAAWAWTFDRVAQARGERGDGRLGVVACAVEAPVNDPLDARS